MKLSPSLLLHALITAASAASDASVYLFQDTDSTITSNPPTLTPEQARLVFAQRLGASQYHGLGDASSNTLSYINTFGGKQPSLFQDVGQDKAAELLIIIEGVSHKSAKSLLDAWSSIKPAFKISSPPSAAANVKLGKDLSKQVTQSKECGFEDAINPFDEVCWDASSKVIHFDLSKASDNMRLMMDTQERLIKFAKQGAMNTLVVLMPESSRTSKTKNNPYGSYEMPKQARIGRRQVEEPMTDLPLASASDLPPQSKQLKTSNDSSPAFEPITGVPPVCYSSLDSCANMTNGCSGHGKCYQKRAECFACGCVPQNVTFIYGLENRTGRTIEYWGGAACQKKDVSGPFWLLFTLTVVLVGLVSWAIGLMYSIGEEKLPGVIGAGVSNNKAK